VDSVSPPPHETKKTSQDIVLIKFSFPVSTSEVWNVVSYMSLRAVSKQCPFIYSPDIQFQLHISLCLALVFHLFNDYPDKFAGQCNFIGIAILVVHHKLYGTREGFVGQCTTVHLVLLPDLQTTTPTLSRPPCPDIAPQESR
jgi:hypothetical protein